MWYGGVVNRADVNSQRLPHPESQHKTLPDLDGIASGGADPGLIVDAYPNKRRHRRRQGLIDEALEILFVRSPGAVGKTAADGDGDDIGNRGGRGRLRAGDL